MGTGLGSLQAEEHLAPPHPSVLVRPGTCLTLNLEFEMLYKPIAFMFFSPSPLARFLCLLTNPSCSYLNSIKNANFTCNLLVRNTQVLIS